MRTKPKKILAGAGAVILIVLLLLFGNSWVGNPVSGLLAKRAAQAYAEAAYSALSLTAGQPRYNFKEQAYCVLMQSSTNRDTVFTVYVDSFGHVIGDDYAHEWANNMTTLRRLGGE